MCAASCHPSGALVPLERNQNVGGRFRSLGQHRECKIHEMHPCNDNCTTSQHEVGTAIARCQITESPRRAFRKQGADSGRISRSALHRSYGAAADDTDTAETGPASLGVFVAATELCNAHDAHDTELRGVIFIDTGHLSRRHIRHRDHRRCQCGSRPGVCSP
jgi:hypothetical protein